MVTVDQMIAALQAFKAEHGGDRQVVRCDPFGNHHFMSLDDMPSPAVVVELIDFQRPGYFDRDDDEDPRAVPVFVVD